MSVAIIENEESKEGRKDSDRVVDSQFLKEHIIK